MESVTKLTENFSFYGAKNRTFRDPLFFPRQGVPVDRPPTEEFFLFISNNKTAFWLSDLFIGRGGDGPRSCFVCSFVCSSTLPLYHIRLFRCVSCLVDSEKSTVNHVTAPLTPLRFTRGPPHSEADRAAACSTREQCVFRLYEMDPRLVL